MSISGISILALYFREKDNLVKDIEKLIECCKSRESFDERSEYKMASWLELDKSELHRKSFFSLRRIKNEMQRYLKIHIDMDNVPVENDIVNHLREKFSGNEISLQELSKMLGCDFAEASRTANNLEAKGIVGIKTINEIGRDDPVDIKIIRFTPPRSDNVFRHPLFVAIVSPLIIAAVIWTIPYIQKSNENPTQPISEVFPIEKRDSFKTPTVITSDRAPINDINESNFKKSDFVRLKKIEKELERLAEFIELKANHREDKQFPKINRSVEATGSTAEKKDIQNLKENTLVYEDYVWQHGVRSIININDNDIPFVESVFFLGRSKNYKEDIVVSKLYRGSHYTYKVLLKTYTNDPDLIAIVAREAVKELINLHPYFMEKIPFDYENK